MLSTSWICLFACLHRTTLDFLRLDQVKIFLQIFEIIFIIRCVPNSRYWKVQHNIKQSHLKRGLPTNFTLPPTPVECLSMKSTEIQNSISSQYCNCNILYYIVNVNLSPLHSTTPVHPIQPDRHTYFFFPFFTFHSVFFVSFFFSFLFCCWVFAFFRK